MLCLVLVAAVGSVIGVRSLVRDDYVASPQQRAGTVADPTGAARTLADWVTALATGDPAAAVRLAREGDAAAADLLAATARNAAGIGVAGLSARYVDELGAVSESGRWQAAVELTWRLTGHDDQMASTEIAVGFAATENGVAISGIDRSQRRVPLWLAGPLEVRRAGATLVLTTGGPTVADRYARLMPAAVRTVRRVLPDWDGRLVLEVPADGDQLAAALDARSGQYAAVAAVTASVDGSSARTAPVHVFVNPVVMGRLEPAGMRIVLAHEATHLATGAATNPRLPLWLAEGFADYVALRDVRLPLTTTAGQLIERVRKQGLPERLPGPEEFDARSGGFGAEYEAAWLACRLLAARSGEAALVRIYDRVGDGADLDATLREETGLGLAGLTRAWRQHLADVAS